MRLNKVKIRQSHNVKLPIKDFKSIIKGNRTINVLKDYKNYQIGERIILMEFGEATYTGREILGEITAMQEPDSRDYHLLTFEMYSMTNRKDVGKFERSRKKGAL